MTPFFARDNEESRETPEYRRRMPRYELSAGTSNKFWEIADGYMSGYE